MGFIFILLAVALVITLWRRTRRVTPKIPAGLKSLPGPKGMYDDDRRTASV